MSTSTVALTIEMPSLDASLSWNALESLVVGMSHEVPARALALALDDAQERLLQEGVRAAVGAGAGPARAVRVPGVRGPGGLRPQGEADPAAQAAHRRRDGRADPLARGVPRLRA